MVPPRKTMAPARFVIGVLFPLESGIPHDVISVFGDWLSDIVYLYLNLPFSQLVSVRRGLQHMLLVYP